MNTRKIILTAASAMFISGIASPAFAEDHVTTNEALFAPKTTIQVEPVAMPQSVTRTHKKTLSQEAFDLTDGR